MSAQIIPFIKPCERLWVIAPVAADQWQGVLLSNADDLTGCTPVAALWKVEMIVNDHRQGLPVRMIDRVPGWGDAA